MELKLENVLCTLGEQQCKGKLLGTPPNSVVFIKTWTRASYYLYLGMVANYIVLLKIKEDKSDC